jgi:6-phosphogluconolactonase (cycloisomerase 2 family)
MLQPGITATPTTATPTPAATASATPTPAATASATPTPAPKPSATPTTAQSASPTPSPNPQATGRIYVTNYSGGGTGEGSITVYASNVSGTFNEPPLATITGSSTMLAGSYGIAVDGNGGEIYASNYKTNSLTVYAGKPSGTLNEAPLATIAGGNTALSRPYGIALDVGSIFVANSGNDSVTQYSAITSGSGNETPYWTFSGSNTDLAGDSGVAVDAGAVYVVNPQTPSITIYVNDILSGDSPSTVISGSNTGLHGPDGIALDSNGNIYVANSYSGGGGSGSGSITVYASVIYGGTINPVPIATIIGSNTGLTNPEAVSVDASGKIYVANSGSNSITVYAANPSGTLNEAPLGTIVGSSTGLNNPTGITVTPGIQYAAAVRRGPGR